jgi:uncharacterized protein (DUF885 family)
MTGDPFERISRSMMEESLSWDPVLATQVGWHKHDHVLRDPTRAASSRQMDRLRDFISALSHLNTDDLTGDQLIDREFALHHFRLRIFEIDELRKDEKGAYGATELGNSLFLLFSRERPSVEERLSSIISRIHAAPEFLEKSKTTVTRPYRLWNEILHETGKRMPRFLSEVCDFFDTRSDDRDQLKRLRKAVSEANEALDDFNDWMRREVIPNASDEISISPVLYRKYLELQGFGVTPEETLSIASMYLEDVNKKKKKVARDIVASGDPSEAVKRMRADHAKDFAGVLKEYRQSVLQAREFVVRNGLVTIPEGEQLIVTPTPSYMAHVVPYAAQYEPGKFDDDRTGLFLVTPDQGNPTILEEHSRAGIVNTSVHEAYPGHHLHGICGNTNPSNFRLLHASPDFAEGWGLYCEEMMFSQGYNATPMGKLTMLNDLGFRIARQICDVKIPMQKMDLDKAAEFLVKETGTDILAATSEAKAMTLSPTYYMSYFVGKLGVLMMKDDASTSLGGRFSLRFFHDSLIYSGCMPMPFMRQALALRIKEKYGIDLGQPKESIYDYAIRMLPIRGA